jgi:hypothetical protein
VTRAVEGPPPGESCAVLSTIDKNSRTPAVWCEYGGQLVITWIDSIISPYFP